MDSLNSIDNTPMTKKNGYKPINKCVRNMSFFLDKNNPPQLNAILAEKVLRLGSKIDPFITKDTEFVVTARPKTEWEQPPKMGNNSPIKFLNNISGFSRGKMLLEKSAHSGKTMDILELARHLKVPILRTGKLMKFLDNCLEKQAKSTNKQSTTNSKQQSPNDSVRKLLPPFVKVVDNSLNYRPNFKELKEWPTMNFEFQPELCPFFKAKPTAANNNGSSHQQQPSVKINLVSQESNKTNNGLKPCAILTTPILTTTNTPHVNNNKSITTVNRNNNFRRKNLTYCEICRRDFVDFEEHLKEEKHANFLDDNENYRELIGVINSLPPFSKEWINNKATQTNEINGSTVDSSGSTNNHLQPPTTYNQTNGLENNSKFLLKSSPMTSVQLTNSLSSNSKRIFLAIHDLEMSDENNPNRNNFPETV